MRPNCRGYFAPSLHFLLTLLMISVISANVITSAPASVTSYLSDPSQTNRDGVGTFFCSPGTFHTGDDGYIGCCSVYSCTACTTSLPYTPGLNQPCNVNTDGCMICSEATPARGTIIKVDNCPNVMYCGQQSIVETISYSDLVPSGSEAFLTSQTKPSSVAMATANNTITSRNVAADAFIPTDGTPIANPGGTLPTTVGAIIMGIVFGFIAIACGIIRIFNIRYREQRSTFQYPSQNSRHRPVELIDNPRLTTASSAVQPASHMDLESQVNDPWANHPAFASNRRTKPTTRWSTNNAPGPSRGEETLEQLMERLSAARQPNRPVKRPYESVDSPIISPNTNNDTATRPAHTYSIQHFERKIRRSSYAARCESPLFKNSSTTVTATGSGSNDIAPETALANEFTGGSAENAAEETSIEEAGRLEADYDESDPEETVAHEASAHDETAAAEETGNEEAVSHVETGHNETA